MNLKGFDRYLLIIVSVLGLVLSGSLFAAECLTVTALTWESTEDDYTEGDADAEMARDLDFSATVSGLPAGKTESDVTWEWKHDGDVISTAKEFSYPFDSSHLGVQTVTVKATVDSLYGTDDCTVNVVERLIIDDVTSRPNDQISFNDKNEVKGHVMPTSVSHLDDKLDWDFAKEGSSSPPSEHCGLWDAKDGDGNIEYVELYGGSLVWPTSNDAWGDDALALTLDKRVKNNASMDEPIDETDDLDTEGGLRASISVDLYYYGHGTENPDPNSIVPNWFYYYKDNAGGGTYQYTTASSSSARPTLPDSIRIADNAYTGNYYWTHDYTNPGNTLKITGKSGTNKYYAHFLGVLAHETQHTTEIWPRGGATDNDSDGLTNGVETGASITDPNDDESAEGVDYGYLDNEYYANGPVEKNRIDAAEAPDGDGHKETDTDWAHPGTNWNP